MARILSRFFFALNKYLIILVSFGAHNKYFIILVSFGGHNKYLSFFISSGAHNTYLIILVVSGAHKYFLYFVSFGSHKNYFKRRQRRSIGFPLVLFHIHGVEGLSVYLDVIKTTHESAHIHLLHKSLNCQVWMSKQRNVEKYGIYHFLASLLYALTCLIKSAFFMWFFFYKLVFLTYLSFLA